MYTRVPSLSARSTMLSLHSVQVENPSSTLNLTRTQAQQWVRASTFATTPTCLQGMLFLPSKIHVDHLLYNKTSVISINFKYSYRCLIASRMRLHYLVIHYENKQHLSQMESVCSTKQLLRASLCATLIKSIDPHSWKTNYVKGWNIKVHKTYILLLL